MTSKRRKWLIVPVCLSLAITLAVVLTRNREPSYQGRTLSEWMGNLLPITSQSSAPDPNGSRAAIRSIGTNAKPHLLEFLVTENEPSGFRNSIKWLLDRSPVSLRTRLASLDRWARMDIDDIRRAQVPMAFEALGPAAVSAIPRLEKLTQDRRNTNLFWYATWSLAAISTNAQPILLAELRGTNCHPAWIRLGCIRNLFHALDQRRTRGSVSH